MWKWSLKADAVAVSGIREAGPLELFHGDVAEIERVEGT